MMFYFLHSKTCADPENFLRVGVQIPRRGLAQNFNMAKINNLAIPGGSGPPVPPSVSAHGKISLRYLSEQYDCNVLSLNYSSN